MEGVEGREKGPLGTLEVGLGGSAGFPCFSQQPVSEVLPEPGTLISQAMVPKVISFAAVRQKGFGYD